MFNEYSTELQHHGILGQKWGVRRFQNSDGSLTSAGKKRYDVKEAKNKYKTSKKEYKELVKKERNNAGFKAKYGVGINGIKQNKEIVKRINKKGMEVLDNKAAIAKAKHGEKGEFKAYRKEMQKSGIRDSVADVSKGGRSTKIYNHLQVKKGKEYADRVEKKVQDTAVKELVGSTLVLAGLAAYDIYRVSH